MLVYGDQREHAASAELAKRLETEIRSLTDVTSGPDRHARLVGLLVETGRLLQGVADAEFASAGEDGRTPATERLTKSLMQLAAAVCRSWDEGCSGAAVRLEPPTADGLPEWLELKVPEGFAFYAVYLEAYIEAARRLRLCAPPRVIGIRSIGTSLAPIVAAVLGAPPPITVRPHGNVFRRCIAIADDAAAELLEGRSHYVIVDEGPGQSGSSFGAVADWLQERGVPSERIAFLPSHAGLLGPQASERHRLRWDRAQRPAADFGACLAALLRRGAERMLGKLDGPPEEVSGGEWRSRIYADEQDWPAVIGAWERRKFLVRADGETWLLKFVGLGRRGEEMLRRARLLHAQGVAPEPKGLVHGFLAERWHGSDRRLASHEKPVAEVASYIALRARAFPAARERGATISDLLAMARRNVGVGLGHNMAGALQKWEPLVPRLERRVRRIETDNKLDRHEWVRTSDGRLLKTDGLDHHAGHDLVGCQDAAWDVAGAAVEFGLTREETALLAAEAGRGCDRLVDPELILFSTLAYSAFRLGQARLAIEMGPATRDRARLERLAGKYEAELRERLHVLEPLRDSARIPA